MSQSKANTGMTTGSSIESARNKYALARAIEHPLPRMLLTASGERAADFFKRFLFRHFRSPAGDIMTSSPGGDIMLATNVIWFSTVCP